MNGGIQWRRGEKENTMRTMLPSLLLSRKLNGRVGWAVRGRLDSKVVGLMVERGGGGFCVK
jgi:hypothetical protein